jgi:hypothetical protein
VQQQQQQQQQRHPAQEQVVVPVVTSFHSAPQAGRRHLQQQQQRSRQQQQQEWQRQQHLLCMWQGRSSWCLRWTSCCCQHSHQRQQQGLVPRLLPNNECEAARGISRCMKACVLHCFEGCVFVTDRVCLVARLRLLKQGVRMCVLCSLHAVLGWHTGGATGPETLLILGL